ncbi:uncharacterized protein SCHCODRAFT_02493135 [Schizophyllum commune H4-8]|uniref:Uncharacterized protein n=1 Tax=Schizophyllum commune (strain H4-8 / FGSC 9210) TaxID=578458 RepID=D8Q0C9_SCHCM|nr:uncharacterized protein SCHCODRAFT_02493135 [Schizophyllum commune H4-8]KAI5896748.1 hypothetical protein SCHCODRAFT_02493135 [Schizophyllum commune H4-8]
MANNRRLDELMWSNKYTPNAEETKFIEERLRYLAQKDNEYDKEIATLREGQALIQKEIFQKRALLAPIRRIPAEILSEIFIAAVPDDWSDMPLGIRRLNIVDVCCYWRALAYRTADLWKTIHLYSRDTMRRSADWETKALSEIKRAGESLHLDMNLIEDTYVQRAFLINHGLRSRKHPLAWNTAVWDAACARSRCWETASLKFLPTDVLSSPLKPPLPLPRLHTLALGLDNGMQPCVAHMGYFQDAPNVKDLRLDLHSPLNRSIVFPSCWALETLSIVFDSTHGFVLNVDTCVPAVLRCAPTLRSLRLSGSGWGLWYLSDDDSITFPFLQDLRLEEAAIHLCRLISAPKVQNVKLVGNARFDEGLRASGVDEHTAFARMVAQSGGCKSMRSLQLCKIAAADPFAVIQALRVLPSLQSLRLENAPYPDNGDQFEPPRDITAEIMTALTRSEPESMQFLPVLADLQLDFVDADELQYDDHLWAMISIMWSSRMTVKRWMHGAVPRWSLLKKVDTNLDEVLGYPFAPVESDEDTDEEFDTPDV